ncbi:HAMP domain-containing sensor histidine kinase [Clostridium ljungdahlii]|uniref:histidine kinase n=2 Tax=Clostridium ljungdahlii TaxID=1538 RepID=D8GIW9_CLOLD|nr:HAMP domain-containing sensor histidine kinase [Clostridium ljungdahlii]ADK15044.1 predicted signal transduction histidine kinase [Clostridium ljungdahlii DSM 13528]OAA87705.1 Alkaline phosphatase synthesis sensor protein PhoR [Clostridium ljungdahlii DSM 13528]
MKFWEKIFLCTLVIFEIFFVPSSIYLINSNFKLNLNTEIDSGINEQQRFCSFVESNLFLFKIQKESNSYKTELDKQSIDSMISTYLNNFGKQDIYIEVIDNNNKVIFTNLSMNISDKREELNVQLNKVKYIIRDIDEKNYLFITKKINLDNNYYKISYVKDVSSIYENKKYLLNLLLKLNIFVCIILIIVTIALSKFIVNPINKLIKTTQKIAAGNFSERVKVISDDEIGLLSKNFNDMADVVEDKINELEMVSEDKQRFIDNLAHELRTPLTSIIGYADFLRTTKYDEETFINSLSYIYSEGKRLEKLAFKLMDLIILRKKDFKMKSENVLKLLVEIKDSMQPKLEKKNIHLEILAEDLNLSMDKELMTVMITNFVDNAVKASQIGDKIYLKAYKYDASNIILEVKDSGIGIPEEDISKVMKPFFMVDKSRARASNGVGLGLSLCVEIAKIHNARIDIESKVGEGTAIKVIFYKNF